MILRIRDADGNVQEIIAIRGEPGKDGKDYVLTEADKQEIADMINEGGGVPQEVTDHLTDEGNPHKVTWAQVRDGAQNDIASAVATALESASIAYVGSVAPTGDVGKDGDIYIVSG